jgi:hypothetical protein
MNNIKSRITKFFEEQPKPKVKFKVVNSRHVSVNNVHVIKKDYYWIVQRQKFTFKKSAVAYAVYETNKDNQNSSMIIKLDSQLSKLHEDILQYKRPTTDKIKKLNRLNRLSAVLPEYYSTKKRLDSLVQSVKLA